jgi:hypothetical protein
MRLGCIDMGGVAKETKNRYCTAYNEVNKVAE